MSYADVTYYKEDYLGTDPGDDTVIAKALKDAAMDIDAHCNGQFEESDYYATQWTLLKDANCAQAEWYIENGNTYNSMSGDSASIGKFSYSGGNSMGGASMAPRTKMLLAQSGLCNSAITARRGCGCD